MLIQVFSKFIIVRRTEKKDSKRFPKKSYFDVETWIVSRTVQSRVNFNHKLNVITNRMMKLFLIFYADNKEELFNILSRRFHLFY